MPRLSFALVIPAAVIATMAVGLSSADAAAVSGHNPVGYFDSIKAQNGGFSVSGWAADPDSSVRMMPDGVPYRIVPSPPLTMPSKFRPSVAMTVGGPPATFTRLRLPSFPFQ